LQHIVDHVRVQVEWPDDLPLAQRAPRTEWFNDLPIGLPLSEYNPETSEKISVYFLNKGYKLIDTITKDEWFRECQYFRGPHVKNTRCSHQDTKRISAPRQYHVLQKP
jgi:hypothetical protein